MEYLNEHMNTLGGGKYQLLAFSQDGNLTIVSGIFKHKGRRYHFYRNELERA